MKANKRKIMKAIAISKIIMEAEMDVMRLWNERLPGRVLMLRYGAAAIEVGKMQATPSGVFSAKRPRVDLRRHRRRERKQVIIRTQVEPNTSADEIVRLITEGIKDAQRREQTMAPSVRQSGLQTHEAQTIRQRTAVQDVRRAF